MRRSALLIGINSYGPESGLAPLKYAEADAIALASLLEEKCGFETRTLLGIEATRDAIEENLFSAGQGDTFLFFFAGHGQMLSGQYKLYPADSTAAGLRALSFPELARHWQSEFGYERVLAILDACRDEMCGVRGSRGFEIAASRDISTSIQGNKWVEVLYGCSEGQVSYEVDEFGHGLMTKALMEVISNPPGDLDTDILAGAAADWMRAWSRNDPQVRLQEVCRYHRPSLAEKIVLLSVSDKLDATKLISVKGSADADVHVKVYGTTESSKLKKPKKDIATESFETPHSKTFDRKITPNVIRRTFRKLIYSVRLVKSNLLWWIKRKVWWGERHSRIIFSILLPLGIVSLVWFWPAAKSWVLGNPGKLVFICCIETWILSSVLSHVYAEKEDINMSNDWDSNGHLIFLPLFSPLLLLISVLLVASIIKWFGPWAWREVWTACMVIAFSITPIPCLYIHRRWKEEARY
jgi:hypothetical protein